MNDSWSPASTQELVEAAGDGDPNAVEELFARYMPRLERWARGRLPAGARDLTDTQDIVQDVFTRTLARLGEFRPEHSGAFHGYLRQAVLNRVRDEARRLKRRPDLDPSTSQLIDEAPSPSQQALTAETIAEYEEAMAALSETDRELVMMRVELGLRYTEVAQATGRASPDAARMAVSRALVKLADGMAAIRQLDEAT